MKILRVIDSMDPRSGGPCQGIRNSIQAMSKYGVENDVACLNEPGADFLVKDPFKIFALGPAKGPWHYSSKLKKWLEQNVEHYDAVIVHGLWLYPSHAVEKVMRKRDTPWFVMPHGMLDPYFQQDKSRKLKAIRNTIYWNLLEQKVINRANAVLYTTQEELDLAAQTFKGYAPNKAINVGYGIKQPPANSEKLASTFYSSSGLDSDREFILYMSRIHPKKGLDLLIEAFAKESHGRIDLVVAGPGNESSYGQEMKDLAAKYKVEDRVHFTGMLKGDAKWGALYNCSAFALTSHQENFGIAVAEALACSKPVLISNKINIWREIVEGGAGYVENDDSNGAQELIKNWLSTDTGAKAELAVQAERLFHSKFDVDTVVKELIDTIKTESGK